MTVENLPFDAEEMAADLPAPTWTTQVQKTVIDYAPLLRPAALLVLFMLAWFFVVRPVQKHVMSAPRLQAPAEAALAAPQSQALWATTTHELGAGKARAAQLKEQTVELIKQKPVHTARAVQAWLREEPPRARRMQFSRACAKPRSFSLLGEDAAAPILRNLPDEDLERITQEVSTLGHIPLEVTVQALEEYNQMMTAQEFIAVGGRMSRFVSS